MNQFPEAKEKCTLIDATLNSLQKDEKTAKELKPNCSALGMQYVKLSIKKPTRIMWKKRHSPLLPMGKRIASKKKTAEQRSFQGRLEIPVFGYV